MRRRTMVSGLAAIGTGLLASAPALAQPAAYPSRPIRMIVPFAPGGGVDAVGRAVAQRLSERIGVPVVVENRSGASGTIGGQAVQTTAPDGYTVLFSASTHVMARQVQRSGLRWASATMSVMLDCGRLGERTSSRGAAPSCAMGVKSTSGS